MLPSFNGRTADCRSANRGSIPLGSASFSLYEMHPMARRITIAQRRKRTARETARRLAEIPEWDGLLRFWRRDHATGRRQSDAVLTPEQVHEYKAMQMAAFDELPPDIRQRIMYSRNGG
jgi:hypothetical protein